MRPPKTDARLLSRWDIPAALALLTRLPMRLPQAAMARGARAAWAYPLAGLTVGALGGVAGAAALALGIGPMIAAGLALLTTILTTGALHEDGLADCADGFWGGHDRAKRLEIMKDSHIGTYGVLALCLGLGLRWLAIGTLFETNATTAVMALLVAEMLSRGAMTVLMSALPHARTSGLSQHVGRPGKRPAALAGLLAAGGALILLPTFKALALVMLAGIVTLGMARLAYARIGGQTGDVLGATQQVTATAVLLALSA